MNARRRARAWAGKDAHLCQRWNVSVAFIDAEGPRHGERDIATDRR